MNDTPKSPAVWVFDPHHLANQVYNTAMADESQVDDVILLIQARVSQAGRIAGGDDAASKDAAPQVD